MSCTCQECGRQYRVDLIVEDSLWEEIRPDWCPPGGGMLCGICIMEKIESLGRYLALQNDAEPNAASTNKSSPKFPRLEEVIEHLTKVVNPGCSVSLGDQLVAEQSYKFIARKLRA